MLRFMKTLPAQHSGILRVKRTLQGLFYLLSLSFTPFAHPAEIMTVDGPISSDALGLALTHEHVLVDFIGAAEIDPARWERETVVESVLPYLLQAKERGATALFECTPAYLGRDPLLLQALSRRSGLQIVTNTGYYGARENLFLPQHALTETADQLADRWIAEWENGIGNSGVKPGFIKIGVDRGPLSEVHAKLLRAAAKTHLHTGLTIASHTGRAEAALQQIELLKSEGVQADAFIWVHAQSEPDLALHLEAARQGAWISLDGVRPGRIEAIVAALENLRKHTLLDRALLSHDAGWYRPQDPESAQKFRGYTDLFDQLLPQLRTRGFGDSELHQLLVANPAQAFTVQSKPLASPR